MLVGLFVHEHMWCVDYMDSVEFDDFSAQLAAFRQEYMPRVRDPASSSLVSAPLIADWPTQKRVFVSMMRRNRFSKKDAKLLLEMFSASNCHFTGKGFGESSKAEDDRLCKLGDEVWRVEEWLEKKYAPKPPHRPFRLHKKGVERCRLRYREWKEEKGKLVKILRLPILSDGQKKFLFDMFEGYSDETYRMYSRFGKKIDDELDRLRDEFIGPNEGSTG